MVQDDKVHRYAKLNTDNLEVVRYNKRKRRLLLADLGNIYETSEKYLKEASLRSIMI